MSAGVMRLIAGLKRVALLLSALFVLTLILGWFVPAPSTLMIGRWLSGQSVTREWRSLDAIAPALARGVIASEDQKFCTHAGVDFEALLVVISDEDGPSRGASTITMQLVKNLYLWPGRSYLRKALEIPMALIVDLVWSKKRIMELYLNIAEWGDGIYGAEAAARFYFKTSAKDLSASEAARLVAALPNPRRGNLRNQSAASRRVLARMETIGGLTTCLAR